MELGQTLQEVPAFHERAVLTASFHKTLLMHKCKLTRAETTTLRFAEDVLTINPAKAVTKVKKKKTDARERTDDSLKAKKRRQKTDILDEEEYQ